MKNDVDMRKDSTPNINKYLKVAIARSPSSFEAMNLLKSLRMRIFTAYNDNKILLRLICVLQPSCSGSVLHRAIISR